MRPIIAAFVLTALLATAALAVPLPPGTDAAALDRLAAELAAKDAARRGPAYQALRDRDTPARRAQRRDPSLQLMGVDAEGPADLLRADQPERRADHQHRRGLGGSLLPRRLRTRRGPARGSGTAAAYV